jgi:hypothetical protein
MRPGMMDGRTANTEGTMKIRIQVVIESEAGAPEVVEEVACVERGTLQPETLGLTLAEAKDVLQGVQQVLVPQQVADYVEHLARCSDCGRPRPRKGHHDLVIRSLFGRLRVYSPRYYTCGCQPRTTKSVSPLAEVLPMRTTPELQYLETKAAAMESYERAVGWLEEVLPLEGQITTTALRRQVTAVAERLESELSDEEPVIEGCPLEWARLPDPAGPITVGLDGGYVKARAGECPQATAFEVITGKSIAAEGGVRRFAFVQGYDTKARRRLFDLMRSQGMQMNQQVTFLSDGGDTVRELPLYLNPQAEHILDWFHLTMRLTVLGQLTKSVRSPEDLPLVTEMETTVARLKWYLWHGNLFRALQLVEELEFDLDGLAESLEQRKLVKAMREFASYISANRAFIPNYGERYRYGEAISTAFVESTVNQVISKRMVKKQQMRWTRRGAHNLLQIRTHVLDGEYREAFVRWYPGMRSAEQEVALAA